MKFDKLVQKTYVLLEADIAGVDEVGNPPGPKPPKGELQNKPSASDPNDSDLSSNIQAQQKGLADIVTDLVDTFEQILKTQDQQLQIKFIDALRSASVGGPDKVLQNIEDVKNEYFPDAIPQDQTSK
jgi:hypothetical protein